MLSTANKANHHEERIFLHKYKKKKEKKKKSNTYAFGHNRKQKNGVKKI